MPIINGKTCYATVGNKNLSGSLVTLHLMSSKADGAAIYNYFVNNAYYSTVGESGGDYIYTVGGWYQRDRSNMQLHEAYAEITLVFDTQNVLGLTVNSGNANKYDPVYSLNAGTEERPIEQHPSFKCSWAYNLYQLIALGGTPSSVPAWGATDTNPNAIHSGYLWSRTPPTSPDAEHEYVQVQAATKPGRDAYLIPRPSVTSIIYYKTRSISNSDLVADGKLKAPPFTFGYPSTQSCWLVTGCSVSEASDELMAVTTNYQYAAEGWDTDIYPLAT